MSAVGASLYKSATQSLTNGTLTVISFGAGTEGYDSGPCHSESTNPSRITVPGFSDGAWVIGAGARFEQGFYDNKALEVWARVNGTSFVCMERINANGSEDTELSCSGLAGLAAGDYIECLVYQNTGAALDASRFRLWGVLV